jgi:hypothetical protein
MFCLNLNIVFLFSLTKQSIEPCSMYLAYVRFNLYKKTGILHSSLLQLNSSSNSLLSLRTQQQLKFNKENYSLDVNNSRYDLHLRPIPELAFRNFGVLHTRLTEFVLEFLLTNRHKKMKFEQILVTHKV